MFDVFIMTTSCKGVDIAVIGPITYGSCYDIRTIGGWRACPPTRSILNGGNVILHPQKVDREAKQVWDTALAQDLYGQHEAWLAIAPTPITGAVSFAAGFGPIDIADKPGEPDTWIVVHLSRIFRQIKAGK
jgi:hypothetical protein